MSSGTANTQSGIDQVNRDTNRRQTISSRNTGVVLRHTREHVDGDDLNDQLRYPSGVCPSACDLSKFSLVNNGHIILLPPLGPSVRSWSPGCLLQWKHLRGALLLEHSTLISVGTVVYVECCDKVERPPRSRESVPNDELTDFNGPESFKDMYTWFAGMAAPYGVFHVTWSVY